MKAIFGRGHPARAEPANSCAMLQRRSIQLHGPSRGCRVASTGIGRAGTKKIDPQNEEQFGTTARGMCAPAEIAQAVESFDGQGQDGE